MPNRHPVTVRIGVFCGARPGTAPGLLALATEFGRTLATRGAGLVYGACSQGLMGAVAAAAHDGGAPVIGVVPQTLRERERDQDVLGEIHIVAGMHERKALMYEHSDAFAVLPGGLGTLDEFMEVATWNQLRLHRKPIVLVDRGNFFAPLIALLDHMLTQGFISANERSLIQNTDDIDKALDLLGC